MSMRGYICVPCINFITVAMTERFGDGNAAVFRRTGRGSQKV